MNQALDNKSFVIVGGTTGLGLAAAKAFVSEGARVVVVGRNAESLAKSQSALGQAACGLAFVATRVVAEDPRPLIEAGTLGAVPIAAGCAAALDIAASAFGTAINVSA